MNAQQKGSKERQLKADKARKEYFIMRLWKNVFQPGKEFSAERKFWSHQRYSSTKMEVISW